MVWENGCTVIVMMTALVEDGEKQCDRYWPDEGSSLYHIYEVRAECLAPTTPLVLMEEKNVFVCCIRQLYFNFCVCLSLR